MLDGKGAFGLLAWEKGIGQNLGFSSFFPTPGCGSGGFIHGGKLRHVAGKFQERGMSGKFWEKETDGKFGKGEMARKILGKGK